MRRDIYWSLGALVDKLPSISEQVTEITPDRRDYAPIRR